MNGQAGYISLFITTGKQYGQDDRILKSVESEPLSMAAACGKRAL